jgi:AbrB family looped-hinge helix DNA binding protein
MAIAQSRLTAQGQISVPVEVRRRLGIAPGSVIEWDEAPDGNVVVRRAGATTWEEVNKLLFPDGPPPPSTVKEMDEAIGRGLAKKHASRR